MVQAPLEKISGSVATLAVSAGRVSLLFKLYLFEIVSWDCVFYRDSDDY